jgi:hypothetical protein
MIEFQKTGTKVMKNPDMLYVIVYTFYDLSGMNLQRIYK